MKSTESERRWPRNLKTLGALGLATELLRPKPMRTPDQWADQSRVLPAGNAEPGPWRSSRTPYMVPIVRACADPKYRRVIGMLASQMGKTDGVLNVVGHRLEDDPVPTLYV